MLDSFVDPVVGDVVGGRLGPQDEVIAHVLLDEAVAVMAADDRVGQVHVFDFGLQLAAVLLGDLAAEDDGDLVRLADGSVGVEQPLAQLVERGAAMKDQVVAEFDLREEQPMLAAGLLALCCGEERGEAGQPFLAAGRQILGRQSVGQLLETLGLRASRKALEHCWKSMPSSRMRFASQ